MKHHSYDSYFRSIGCVCLCDLRELEDEELSHGVDAYTLIDPWHGDPDPVFLFLRKEAFGSVITYDEAKAGARGTTKMLAPYIEAGHRGDVPLDAIAEAWVVTIDRPPDHPYVAALRKFGAPKR